MHDENLELLDDLVKEDLLMFKDWVVSASLINDWTVQQFNRFVSLLLLIFALIILP